MDCWMEMELTWTGNLTKIHIIFPPPFLSTGTFSSVYKAVDVRHEYYDNSSWDLSAICNDYERINLDQSSSLMSQDEEVSDHESESQEPIKHFVALKRIYVTSSPERITSEIEILHQLK